MGSNPLEHYSQTAARSAGVVISNYSTSFGLACRLLGAIERKDIENIYALVRIADEVVDGAAAAAGLTPQQVQEQLDGLERETEQALHSGYSTNLVVHAFALTARRIGIDASLTAPFFASMRTDVSTADHSAQTLADYIYGSAEVVGLMCLKVFQAMGDAPPAKEQVLTEAACSLGAAFQKVNFLRDLGADTADLGRRYFPGVDPAALTEDQKHELLADIRSDLAVAKAGMEFLAPAARRAVLLAHDLFLALVDRIDAIPAGQLAKERVRVPGYQKTLIAAKVIGGRRQRAHPRTPGAASFLGHDPAAAVGTTSKTATDGAS